MQTRICVQTDDFDMATEYQRLCQQSSEVGAVVCFVGLVRELEGDSPINSLTLEHYPGMTERLLQDIVNQAAERWQLSATSVIHRVGELLPSDQIVLVAVASQHRADAFAAAEFIMDYLKTKATLWKKIDQQGQQHWVEGKASDQIAAERWDNNE
jgi:molybdopterin synthase catalytic subunit